jgi:hypothetical protein
MRIAISGSHSLGKSTVVNDWVELNGDYMREEEPYRVLGLRGPYEILFGRCLHSIAQWNSDVLQHWSP